ncbi:MAG TPA: zinc-dependent alcohol dehydrogenase family protein [Xanthobacteraceae bacterium]|jgi:alcohol dehydrogenase, propanol-preferring|nr:zinc-dependent alcohol dehydrogenase family protein [Xanthobacteraceae bacterium]
MRAMVLETALTPLRMRELPTPVPAAREILLEVAACGVCRTDLHVVDGELPNPKLPLIPGHEIVGRVAALGADVAGFAVGERIGVPWLGYTCGVCPYCRAGRENLCDRPLFTGYTRDGGYATHTLADARFCFPLPERRDDAEIAPFLCAGLIGWRSYRMAGAQWKGQGAGSEGESLKALGLYGFGAAAHILAQVATWQRRRVYAFTRGGDTAAQAFARSLGAVWAGGSDEMPPERLDAAIIFAPVGALVPLALKAVKKGGRVVCGGIHMSDIPSFPYSLLWEERHVVSVANLTRADAREFLDIVPRAGVKTEVTRYPLDAANDALSDLREGRLQGAAVLTP